MGHFEGCSFRPELPEGFDLHNSRILLHCCCAPCSTAILEWMVEEGLRPGVFFSNSNIVHFEEYAKRFPREVSLELVEIPAGKRTKNSDIEKIVNHEGELMLAAVPKGAMIVTMDIPGKMHNTHQLADELNRWKSSGRDVALLVGGPEGLSDACKKAAEASWSLSPLTLPHPIVRIVIAESLYRAWSITANHPYHRE